MKVLKKEVVYFNAEERKAFKLVSELCLTITEQSITYELTEIANKIYHSLTDLEKWVEKDLNNTCNDYEEKEEFNEWLEDEDEEW